MLEVLKNHADGFAPHQRMNATREYLQWIILQLLDDTGYRKHLAFTGGTCLRVVFGIGRFSEDLDFSLVQPKGFDLRALNEAVLRRLELMGLAAESSPAKDKNTVGSFSLKFAGVLQHLGLSPMKSEKLSIKFEVDTRPPAGGVVSEFLFQEPILFMINHFDLPSLFATKIHALLFRGYDKGRDYYDLFFYLRKKTLPSLSLFQAAVKQTHPQLNFPSLDSVFTAIRKKLSEADEKKILRDVGPFLLDPGEERFLKKDVLLMSLRQAYASKTGTA